MYTLQDTEERLLQATTAHAAEKVCVNLSTTESCHILYQGVLQSTIETLTQQLEQKEGINQIIITYYFKYLQRLLEI